MKAALRVLPEGYKRFTRTLRHHPAYGWRDPDGRFHIMAVHGKTGRPTILSFWTDELREMLDSEVLYMDVFHLDPHLYDKQLHTFASRGEIPNSWPREARAR